MVHIGVSGVAQELNLESQAFNDGYCSADISGCLPECIYFQLFVHLTFNIIIFLIPRATPDTLASNHIKPYKELPPKDETV